LPLLAATPASTSLTLISRPPAGVAAPEIESPIRMPLPDVLVKKKSSMSVLLVMPLAVLLVRTSMASVAEADRS